MMRSTTSIFRWQGYKFRISAKVCLAAFTYITDRILVYPKFVIIFLNYSDCFRQLTAEDCLNKSYPLYY